MTKAEAKEYLALPSNLDEAAIIYINTPRIKSDKDKVFNEFTCNHEYMAFKAGAEWMAGQGETHEAEIIESVPFGRTKWQRCVKVWLDNQFQAKGDKVIVQIRKKEE